jgi:hypothetical protein
MKASKTLRLRDPRARGGQAMTTRGRHSGGTNHFEIDGSLAWRR